MHLDLKTLTKLFYKNCIILVYIVFHCQHIKTNNERVHQKSDDHWKILTIFIGFFHKKQNCLIDNMTKIL